MDMNRTSYALGKMEIKKNPILETVSHSVDLETIRNQTVNSPIKTGTTIVGIKGDKYVVLAADTRSTNGPIVADKNCSKIHTISSNISCCGAGTAADTRYTTKLAQSVLHRFTLKYDKISPLSYCVNILKRHLFSYQGHISASLIVGGVDEKGPGLFGVHPHGSVDALPYTAQGSGSYSAIGILETGWRTDMTEEEAVELACDAIEAGISNDLYSGSNIDICVIRVDSKEVYQKDYRRNYREIGKKQPREMKYNYPRESITITKEEVYDLVTFSTTMEVEY